MTIPLYRVCLLANEQQAHCDNDNDNEALLMNTMVIVMVIMMMMTIIMMLTCSEYGVCLPANEQRTGYESFY